MNQDFGINQAFVEELYARYRENPSTVGNQWLRYFDQYAHRAPSETNGHALPEPPGLTLPHGPAAPGEQSLVAVVLRVQQLIHAWRLRGHLWADLDPLRMMARPANELSATQFGLTETDLDTVVPTGDVAGLGERATVRQIIAHLRETYSRSVGVEFIHIEDPAMRAWLQGRMESTANRTEPTATERFGILAKLIDAEIFEQFLHVKFIGEKRFSLEGAESLIPLLEVMIGRSGELGIEEVVIGMAHRGRLNVLANIMGKNVREIFEKFLDQHPHELLGRGDVKYHLGYSSDRVTSSGQPMHLSLAFNPSHLEFVNPVVAGRVRAKQDRRGDTARKRVTPLVIHGDAAMIGQGVVAETFNLMNLEGYTTGGTLHVVVNNQVGFTTDTADARSTRYATDLARMLGVPVFHVNGEDPEAVAHVARLAVDFRQTFGRDVVVDMYCYRKWGHNEADEPRYTQPLMYAAIDKRPSIRATYAQRLVTAGHVTTAEIDELVGTRKRALDEAHDATKANPEFHPTSAMAGLWARYRGGPDGDIPEVSTRVDLEVLKGLLDRITTIPEGVQLNAKTRRFIDDRRARLGGAPLDWGTAESLAFASLVAEGVPIRLSGQDARRGTFSHRLASWVDERTGERHSPFAGIVSPEGNGRFDVYDSPLSETGVLGFDYGYSLDYPDGLVLWEAQFGDFANGAQVIIDQFISSSEDKWNRLSGVVLLLPHGFEGQGPEHSSARLERFLQLCAEDNITVCNLTTPAQIFHALRRQVLRSSRKPLVVMTPKSNLRSKAAVSALQDLSDGGYQRILPDARPEGGGGLRESTRRVLLCSGKVYYDLADARTKRGAHDVAILRLEQLYPLSPTVLSDALAPYRDGTPLVWVQEEPWNMGAWYYLHARLPAMLQGRLPLTCISRDESASPATGSKASHLLEQARLMDRAFGEVS